MSGSFWERFEHDPRRPENAPLRAGDRDRDVVGDLLGTAYSDGRLTREELDERTDDLSRTKTLGELPSLVRDLVAPTGRLPAAAPGQHRAEAVLRYSRMRSQALWAFLTPTLICWIVWVSVLAGGGGTWFPWPAFVTLGTGMRFFQLATSKESTIASIERSLQRKEERRLEKSQRREALPPPVPPEQG